MSDVLGDPTTSLRADLLTPVVEAVPGESVRVDLDVTNLSEVIETIAVNLVGPQPERFTSTPSALSLFPAESGVLGLDITFARSLPAGTHEMTLVVDGTSGWVLPVELTLYVHVPAHAAASVVAEPPVVTAGRRGRFDIGVANDGNTPLVIQVRAADADRRLKLGLEHPTLAPNPGGLATTRLVARGPRPWTGSPREHVIVVDIEADGIAAATEVRFRQRPRLTAGLITALTLLLIVALWALAMLFGVTAALAPPTPKKEIPASFEAGQGVGVDDLDPAAVGGGVTGTVTAASTAQPAARITVEAYDSRGRLAGATATDDDGVYELESLLPSRYVLRFSSVGYEDIWFPDAPSADAGTAVSVSPDAVADGLDARIVGLPGSLGGRVIAGDGGQQPVTVEVVPLDLLTDRSPRSTTTDGNGLWSIAGLTAPATYRISYSSSGYTVVDVTEPLDAGAQTVVNTVRLPAATGAVSGIVRDRNGEPVGGIEIEARRGEDVQATTTPTAGLVGTFGFVDLTTPGTYLLTFRGEGFADETQAIRLGPGASVTALEVVLAPATGLATGLVTSDDGTPLGGVTVTVSGGSTAASTETFTSGDIGRFRLADLAVPGTYAVTFALEGFTRETVQIELTAAVPEVVVDIQLAPSFGELRGIVVDTISGEFLGAVTIQVSDGERSRLTTTASEPESQRGRFVVTALPVGTYTITATTEDGRTRTLLRRVDAGVLTEVRIEIGASP